MRAKIPCLTQHHASTHPRPYKIPELTLDQPKDHCWSTAEGLFPLYLVTLTVIHPQAAPLLRVLSLQVPVSTSEPQLNLRNCAWHHCPPNKSQITSQNHNGGAPEVITN